MNNLPLKKRVCARVTTEDQVNTSPNVGQSVAGAEFSNEVVVTQNQANTSIAGPSTLPGLSTLPVPSNTSTSSGFKEVRNLNFLTIFYFINSKMKKRRKIIIFLSLKI